MGMAASGSGAFCVDRSDGPRRIAFVNEKGGSAKTTLVSNLAAHLALNLGHRVLAIDMDPQGQLGKVLGLDVRGADASAVDLLMRRPARDSQGG